MDVARRVARDTQHVTRSPQVLAGRFWCRRAKPLPIFSHKGDTLILHRWLIDNQCLWTRRTRNSPRGCRAGWAPLGSLDVASSPTAPPLVVPRSFGACRPRQRRESVSGIRPYPEQARTETPAPLEEIALPSVDCRELRGLEAARWLASTDSLAASSRTEEPSTRLKRSRRQPDSLCQGLAQQLSYSRISFAYHD